MIIVPDQEKLDAIKAQGYSGSVLSKQVGLYRLSCVYRECSALGAHGSWYPETQIIEGNWVKQDGRLAQWPPDSMAGRRLGLFPASRQQPRNRRTGRSISERYG